MKNLIGLPIAVVLSTVLLFMWGFISWMILPWHTATTHRFADEAAVADVLKANAPKAGMYMLPFSKDTSEAGQKAMMEKRQAGPFFFGSVRPGASTKSPDMSQNFTRQIITLAICSFIVGILLWIANIPYYTARLLFVIMIAVFAALAIYGSYWNWFEFSTKSTVVNIADFVVGWTLSGLVMAALIRPTAI